MSMKTTIREDYLPFWEVYRAHNSYVSNKWEHYLQAYERFFFPYASKNEPVNLLEIGVQNGGSLQVWQEYLPKGSKIIGIDINPKCNNLEFAEGITFLHGSASDKDFIEANLKDNKFDIIIDDGSHHSPDVIASFEMLFSKLNLGGMYLVEDSHASYWERAGGGFRKDMAMIEYFKRLADAIHYRYYDIAEEAQKIKDIKILKPMLEEAKTFAAYNREIASISFYDSIIAIEKYTEYRDGLFATTLTEGESLVVDKSIMFESGTIEYTKDTKIKPIYKI